MSEMFIQLTAFFSAVWASFLAWYLVVFLVKPRLVIDDKIYKLKSVDNKESFVYKVKVTNKSRFFDVYDIDLAARVYLYGLNPDDKNEYRMYVINSGVKSSPYISSKRKISAHFHGNERYFVLKPPYGENRDADKGKLRRLYCRFHTDKPNDFLMTLEDVFHIIENEKDNVVIEFAITATSTFSAKRLFYTKCFKEADIKQIDDYDNEASGE